MNRNQLQSETHEPVGLTTRGAGSRPWKSLHGRTTKLPRTMSTEATLP